MRTLLTTLTICCFCAPLFAQDYYPDAFGDMHNTATGIRENIGQVRGTDLVPTDEVIGYFEGYGTDIWLRKNSAFTMSKVVRDTAVTTPDTLYSVSVKLTGENAQAVDPDLDLALPGHASFYYPWTETDAVDALSYHHASYKNVYPDISLHFYTSRGGPKLAFYFEPGSNPADLLMEFTGPDSLAKAWDGTLELYLGGKTMELREAVAYQVDGTDIIPVAWSAEYVIVDDDGLVTFAFDTYDTELPLILQIGAPAGPAWEPTDPRNMLWCTYAGSNDADEFMAADVDANGDAYVCGYAYQNNFPVNTGYQVFPAYDGSHAGSEDAVAMKFDHDNKQILWATYLGGSATSTGPSDEWAGLDKAYDLAAYKGSDPDLKYVFVTGASISEDFLTYRNPLSVFVDADETAPTGGSGGIAESAFIVAYTEYDGHLDWSTTLGPSVNDAWVADGLGVDVTDDGTLVWVGRATETPLDPDDMEYPLVTPTGAFTKENGGGFFVLFDADYQILWNTFFGSMSGDAGVYDVKITSMGNPPKKTAFITGITNATTDPLLFPLDVYNPPGSAGFYQSTPGGGSRDAYVARLNLETYQLEYCTYWGGNGYDQGVALEVITTIPHGYKQVWVGGITLSTDLSSDHLPAPGTGGLHQTTNDGDGDGMILCFDTQPDVDLNYGTLYGGAGSDAVLDLEAGSGCVQGSGDCQIYATGETGSPSGMIPVTNALLYLQEDLGNVPSSDRLDAYILAIDSYDKSPIWATYIGGTDTDKGWGIAAAPEELFLVGGAISDQATFPLKEFDTGSPLDWYDDDLSNNIGSSASGYYSFNTGGFYYPIDHAVGDSEPWPGHAHDAFIASFEISTELSIHGVSSTSAVVLPVLLDPQGLWSIPLLDGTTTLRLFDARGRLLQEIDTHGQRELRIDLRQRTAGMYAVTCLTQAGTLAGAKLLKP